MFHVRKGVQDSYSIFSDHPTDGLNFKFDTFVDFSGIVATDPVNKKYIIGDIHGHHGIAKDQIFLRSNLESSYGVKITKIKGCGTSKHLLFDSFGRTHCSKSQDDNETNPYYDNTKQKYTMLKRFLHRAYKKR